MAEENPEKPFFEVDLSPVYGRLSFKNLEQVREWFDKQHEFFKFLWNNKAVPLNQHPGSAFQRMRGMFESLSTDLNSAASAGADERRVRDYLNNVQSQLQQVVVAERKAMLSDDPRAIHVKKLWESKQARSAAFLMAAFLREYENVHTPEMMDGILQAFAFNNGIHGTAESTRTALEILAREFREKISEATLQYDKFQSQIKVAIEREEAQIASQRQTYKKVQEERKESFDKLVENAQTALKAVETTYDEKLALQSAVQYWKRKASSHSKSAWGFTVAALVFSFLYFGSVFRWSNKITAHVSTGLDIKNDIDHIRVGSLLVLILFGIWALRILVRLTLSHVHLTTDCAHRRTLVLTYLALLRKKTGDAVTEKERSIVMEQIFRPTADGIVRDDAMPSGPWEFASRGLSGRV